MNVVPILFTFDENLLIPAGVCITSLLESADKDSFYDIIVLHPAGCDFSNSRLLELPGHYKNCRISFRKVVGEFEEAFEIRGIPKTAYYRLISPSLIPEYDHYLYSDVDVIFREDQSKYYSLPIKNFYFAGVDSIPGINEEDMMYLKTIGLNPQKGYYYSGNLIINADAIRRDGKMDEFRSHRLKKYVYQDMDIINLVCNERIKPLPPAFCLTSYLLEKIVHNPAQTGYSQEEISTALNYGTIHYNGVKPWQRACPNMDIWWSYYRRSIFYDERFAYEFWTAQRDYLIHMPLMKRIKVLFRYLLDRREW